MPDYILAFGIVAIVLCVTALASGVVERSPISYPLIFLGLGFLLGEGALNLVEMGPHSPILEIVAALTLSLVLFLDAVKLQLDQLKSRWAVPALVLGPGTATIIGLGAVGLAKITGFSWTMAFLGGAVLASTDPVVLREIVRDHRIPRSVRQILKIEAGTNDIVVLPVVLVLIAVATRQAGDVQGWAVFMAKLLLLGPFIGFGVGGAGSWLMNQIDRRMSIRREHQAFYGVGLVLAAYAAAAAAGGDGFLAAFAAGLAVVLLNQSLCDCFMEYGEVTSEMAMLLAFVLFGIVLSGMVGSVAFVPALGLAALVIFVIRPAVLALVLARAKMSWEAHAFVCWFGPRGLNSLLLALLAVQAEVPGGELLLATVGIVVTASVLVHGASAVPLSVWYGKRTLQIAYAEERESTAAGLFGHSESDVPRVTPQELNSRMISSELPGGDPPIVLDVRTRSSYEHDGFHIPGDTRLLPDEVVEWGATYAGKGLVVAYCT
ncbi:MAG: hypothetical protein BZY80_06830 [SAR202 cluster bacterium Io17-Chloro-G2]|nr:MAG: hypothetical protein BZY80_06830 [SAR202 cluster bacterium Io17-Chloro-G2]